VSLLNYKIATQMHAVNTQHMNILNVCKCSTAQ